uniref:Uncharacterized protein n=1 Tax=Caenorhabditis japonica TaxID=281687 RepID=A0A8R1ELQ3_CAEJA
MDHFRPDPNHPTRCHSTFVSIQHEITIRIWFGKFVNKDFSLDDASRSGLSVWWSVHGVHHWKLLGEGKTIMVEYFSVQLQKVRAQLKLSPLKCHRVQYLHDNPKTTCGKNNKVTAGNVQLDNSRLPTVQPRPCPYCLSLGPGHATIPWGN